MDTVIDNFPTLLDGFFTTVQLTLIAGAASLVLGTVLGAFRVSPVPPLRWFGTFYVETVRNTPLTLVFFFFVFVAPRLNFTVDFYISACIALSLYTAAFVCEAVRSGVNSVAVGQAEAARAVGMTFSQTLAEVIMPQALRSIVPPLINVLVALTKNTSIAAGFFVTDLVGANRTLVNDNPADVYVLFAAVAMFYFAITIPGGLFASRLERRVAIAR